ncbi:DUF7695 domain-containing protein [Glaesserella parasuis]|uniref:DUF7695 domain-containing protein n=1 Tax=Glaesserella parasuis TaxID=738 RepID=UPI003B6834E0
MRRRLPRAPAGWREGCALSIDGGNEYPRRLYNKPNSYQDLSEYDIQKSDDR